MKKILLIFLILLPSIFLSGCRENNFFCIKDKDCIVSGCSSEICANKPLASVCIFKPEYACLKFSKCRCINFKCEWEKTKEYEECMKNISNEKRI